MTPEQANLLGQLVRTKRERLHLSMRQLADVVHVNPSTITRLEHGNFLTPKDATMQRLAIALDIKQSELARISARYVVPADLPDFPLYLIAKYPELSSSAMADLVRRFDALRSIRNDTAP